MVFVKAISLISIQNLEWQSKIDQQDRSLIWFGAIDGLTVLFSPKQKEETASCKEFNISKHIMVQNDNVCRD